MIRTLTHTLIIAALSSIVLGSCRKTEVKKQYVSVESYENLAQVATRPIDSVSYVTAYGTCEVVSEGNSPVTECGLCWDTDPQPLRLGTHIATGQGIGFTHGKIEGLKPATKYYLRAYAKNNEGISYGNEVTFTTSAGWSRMGANPDNTQLTELFFASGVLYASGYSRTYVSNNLAKSWNTPLSGTNCFAAKNNSVFAGGDYQLYITADNGYNWSNQYIGNSIMDLLVTNILYVTTSYGVRRSLDGGLTWTTQNTGLSGSPLTLAAKGNDLYVGGSTGIYKSVNTAASWTSVKQGLNVLDLEVSGANVLAGTTLGVYISKDDGLTWTSTGFLPTESCKVYCLGNNVVAWSLTSNLVYMSTDNGLTWRKSIYTDSETPTAIGSDGITYFASSSSGIFTLSVNSK